MNAECDTPVIGCSGEVYPFACSTDICGNGSGSGSGSACGICVN